MKNARKFYRALLGALLLGCAGVPATVLAQSCCPSDGHGAPAAKTATVAETTQLGQSWPQVTDQSRCPSWHAYEFALNGINYVQVNDLGGVVHFAAAVGSGSVVVLPVGTDVALVSTPAAPITPTLQDVATLVFQADGITVQRINNPSGGYWLVGPSN